MKKTIYFSLMLGILMLAASCGTVSVTQMRYKNGLNIGLCKLEEAKPSAYTKASSSQLKGYAIKNDYVSAAIDQDETLSPVNFAFSASIKPLKAPVSEPKSVTNKVVLGKVASKYMQNMLNKSQQNTQLQNTADNTTATQATHSGGKSQIIALVLAFFLGGLGIHRFYLGYTTIGLIQLLTAGGCGIWALIDFIRILLGDLQPMDGDYDETL